MATKFTIIFTAFGIFTILCIAYIVYRSEYRVHKEYQLEAVKKVNSYINQIITDDGEDFISFAKLLPEYADEKQRPWRRTSAAIGVALFDPGTDKCIDDTFKRADKLMYEYKKKMKAVRKD